MYEDTDLKMLVTGPRQGEMSEMVRLELLSPSNKPLILFGAGSAVNFIIDALQWSSVNKPVRKKVSLIYTTRDYELFDWAMASITKLLEPCEERGIFFDCKMAYTGKALTTWKMVWILKPLTSSQHLIHPSILGCLKYQES